MFVQLTVIYISTTCLSMGGGGGGATRHLSILCVPQVISTQTYVLFRGYKKQIDRNEIFEKCKYSWHKLQIALPYFLKMCVILAVSCERVRLVKHVKAKAFSPVIGFRF